jgi:hypothetical protein
METLLATTWNTVMDSRFNPLKHMDLASSHYLMQVLAWMWSMIFSVSFFSIYVFSYVWLSHMLVIAGVFVTLTVFNTSSTRRVQSAPALRFSSASKCVWKMDSEA